jgi:ferredoxin
MFKVTDECVGCGGCISGYDGDETRGCPVKAISLSKSSAVIDQDKCVQCGNCAAICALGAIEETA